jgi:uncharacterized protein (TIGR03083 family)
MTDSDDLAAYATDAMELDELDALDRRGVGDPLLNEAAGLLAAAAATTAPPHVRGRILTTALTRRGAGTASDNADPISRPESYLRTIAELDELLGSLTPDQQEGRVAAYADWTVKDLLAHLVAVEQYFGSVLELWTFDGDTALLHDHIAFSVPTVVALAETPWVDVLTEWRRLAAAVGEHTRLLQQSDLARMVHYHYLDLRVAGAFVLRAFELWTHTEDIRSAAGLTQSRPEGARLRVLGRQAVAAVPFGLLLLGEQVAGRSARFVLTGEGGGTFVQALTPGDAVEAEDVVIVADVLSFCRLAAQRLDPLSLAVTFEGDAELGRRVLAGAAVFAA